LKFSAEKNISKDDSILPDIIQILPQMIHAFVLRYQRNALAIGDSTVGIASVAGFCFCTTMLSDPVGADRLPRHFMPDLTVMAELF